MSYVEPFFVLIKSLISRFKARLGSKFCGSQAFTTQCYQQQVRAPVIRRGRTYEAL